jgi:hypothetical protein
LNTRSSGRIQVNAAPICRLVMMPERRERARANRSSPGLEKAAMGACSPKSSRVTA